MAKGSDEGGEAGLVYVVMLVGGWFLWHVGADRAASDDSVNWWLQISGGVLLVITLGLPIVMVLLLLWPCAAALCKWINRFGQYLAERRRRRTVDRDARAAELALQRNAYLECRAQEQHRSTARREAANFYDRHRNTLSKAYPRALFSAQLNAAIPPAATPQEAWAASRDLIGQLQAFVEREDEQQRRIREQEEHRQRQTADLDRQIAEHRKKIERLKISSLPSPTANEEIRAIEYQIEELEAEKRALDIFSNEGTGPRAA